MPEICRREAITGRQYRQWKVAAFAGSFHSLVIPAQAGIYMVLSRQSYYRRRLFGFPPSRERRGSFNPNTEMKRPAGPSLKYFIDYVSDEKDLSSTV